MYAPNGNSIYPQQLQQHKQPQQFTNNPPPGYQMNQMQPMPVVVQQPSMYKILT